MHILPKVRRAAMIVGLVLLAMGALSARLAAQDDPYAGIHTVGIISALGNTAVYQKRGVTVFDASYKSFPLDWDVDAGISQVLSAELKSRFDTKPLPSFPATVSDVFLKTGIFDSGPDFKKLSVYLKASPSAKDVDAFIVVVPAKIEEDAYLAGGHFAHTFSGLGVYRDTSLTNSILSVDIYATFAIVFVEAKTGNVISWAYADALGNTHHRENYIYTHCFGGNWPTTADGMSRDQKQTANAQLAKIVFRALPSALKGIGLTTNSDIPNDLPTQPASIECTEPS